MKFKRVCSGEYRSVGNKYRVNKNEYCTDTQWDIYILTAIGYSWIRREDTKAECVEYCNWHNNKY